MKFVSVTQLSAIGKSVLGFILALGVFMQIPAVAAVVTAAAHDHPHIAIAVGTFTTLLSLCTNPTVQKFVGYVPNPPATPGAPNVP